MRYRDILASIYQRFVGRPLSPKETEAIVKLPQWMTRHYIQHTTQNARVVLRCLFSQKGLIMPSRRWATFAHYNLYCDWLESCHKKCYTHSEAMFIAALAPTPEIIDGTARALLQE